MLSIVLGRHHPDAPEHPLIALACILILVALMLVITWCAYHPPHREPDA